jgi:hypothetical protein
LGTTTLTGQTTSGGNINISGPTSSQFPGTYTITLTNSFKNALDAATQT